MECLVEFVFCKPYIWFENLEPYIWYFFNRVVQWNLGTSINNSVKCLMAASKGVVTLMLFICTEQPKRLNKRWTRLGLMCKALIRVDFTDSRQHSAWQLLPAGGGCTAWRAKWCGVWERDWFTVWHETSICLHHNQQATLLPGPDWWGLFV